MQKYSWLVNIIHLSSQETDVSLRWGESKQLLVHRIKAGLQKFQTKTNGLVYWWKTYRWCYHLLQDKYEVKCTEFCYRCLIKVIPVYTSIPDTGYLRLIILIFDWLNSHIFSLVIFFTLTWCTNISFFLIFH